MAKVFRKRSVNGSISLYLGRRDFVDRIDTVDTVDGVVKVDPAELKGRKVLVQLACAFRYGRDDLDVIDLSFKRHIWSQTIQVYPATGEADLATTPTQEILVKKAGDQGHPFTFTLPKDLPCSVSIQPAARHAGKPCGVDFEVKAYIGNEQDGLKEKEDNIDSCSFIIRKIQYAPSRTSAGPRASIKKRFLMCTKAVFLEASLDKEVYCHGEPISITVKINNNTGKVVKKIRITIDQTTDVLLYSADKYTTSILYEEFADQVHGNTTFEKVYQVTPLLGNNKDKLGLALDGKLKDEDTDLASTTLKRPGMDKEILGILVSYKIKTILMVSRGGLLGDLTARDVSVELPLVPMSPKPAGENLSCENQGT
ncbi:arrestin 3b, retinal (X-arrestin) [Paramormyrops kingsleyae]|uniref:arrestin 3b, retinal (X-arrestin) n=1 Tax=Paramormyrops kingsleyae TaxID=1676925 RepID=UPI000CD6096B|nr:arrestin-C [Paramormyrops kingsleyae]